VPDWTPTGTALCLSSLFQLASEENSEYWLLVYGGTPAASSWPSRAAARRGAAAPLAIAGDLARVASHPTGACPFSLGQSALARSVDDAVTGHHDGLIAAPGQRPAKPDPVVVFVAAAAVWFCLGALTVVGLRHRGSATPVRVVATLLAFPASWTVWYVVDRRPSHAQPPT